MADGLPVETPEPARKAHWFTKDNAKAMSAKGLAKRWSAEHQTKRAIEQLDGIAVILPEHQQKRLARVQHQLDLIDGLILAECEKHQPDAQKLDRLASAQMRLAEQERILAGRPLPGSLKPASPRSRRQPQSFDPIDPPAT